MRRAPDPRDAEMNKLSQRVGELEKKVEDMGKKLGDYSLNEIGLSKREMERMRVFRAEIARFREAEIRDLEAVKETVLRLHQLQKADHSRIAKLVTQTRPSASSYSYDSRQTPLITRPTTAPSTRPRGRVIPPATRL
jgi:hypothetical protein